MKRIDSATKAVDLFGVGKHGFTAGDPVNGILATRLSADWFNGVQEEIANVIEGLGGGSLDGADLTQLRQAIEAYVAASQQSAPAGHVDYFAMQTPPAGYLKANGAAVSRTTYADLFAAIGTTYGAGDGSTTFNLPDLRGEFVRGWDDGRGVDSGRAFGSAQADELASHTHTTDILTGGSHAEGGANARPYTYSSGAVTGATGGTETRPRNVALLACIKY